MNSAFIFSMYNEHLNVLNSINEIKSKITADVFISHSFDKDSEYLNNIRNSVLIYNKLENLYPKIPIENQKYYYYSKKKK